MKKVVFAKIKTENKQVAVRINPDEFEMFLIESLFSDNCSLESMKIGEKAILKLAEESAKDLGEIDKNYFDCCLINYKMETE